MAKNTTDGATSDPIELIMRDHREVEQMFEALEDAEPQQRQALVDRLVEALEAHMDAEEQLVYPIVEDEVDKEVAEEAEAEHRLAREGLSQLRALSPDEPGFDGAVTMLKAGILHHVEEEETDALPKLRERLDEARMRDLGEQLASRLLSGKSGNGARSGNGNARSSSGESSDLHEHTKAELVEQAKEAGVTGYSNMKKDELIETLEKQR